MMPVTIERPRFIVWKPGPLARQAPMKRIWLPFAASPWNRLFGFHRCVALALQLCLLLAAGRVSGADVSYYGVVKSIFYQQTNDSVPSILAGNAYGFTAFVVASTNNVVTNATVKPSNSTPLRQLLPDTNQVSWRFEDFTNSQSALDAVYPTGTLPSPVSYTTTMYTTNDGVQSGAVSFSLLFVPLNYPTTPQLTNLTAAQDIDTTRDFQLGWNSLGGSTLAVVQLTVLDSASNLVYATPFPFQTGALNGASFSAVIPAYALPPGTNLQGHLSIGNPGTPNTGSYPGATGIAALGKDTQFGLKTRAAPSQPQLQVLPSQGGLFQLRLSGETNRIYQIQAASDFLSWTNLFTTNCLEGTFDYTDPAPMSAESRFYRAKVGQ